MYFAIETRSAWDDTIHFSPSLLIELKFWFCNIDCFNGYSIRPPLATHTVVFSDASDVAWVNIGDFGEFDKIGNFGDLLPISSS